MWVYDTHRHTYSTYICMDTYILHDAVQCMKQGPPQSQCTQLTYNKNPARSAGHRDVMRCSKRQSCEREDVFGSHFLRHQSKHGIAAFIVLYISRCISVGLLCSGWLLRPRLEGRRSNYPHEGASNGESGCGAVFKVDNPQYGSYRTKHVERWACALIPRLTPGLT
jgi:hypothetical protein